MKALSILQPWAWLIVNGHKDIENRCWRTTYRGRFLVHAGKSWGPEQRDDVARVREDFPHIVLPDTFELCGIVGAATLVSTCTGSTSPWFVGPWGFVLEDQKPLPFMPWRGRLQFFDVHYEEPTR